jgi:hypothetical protein
VREQATLKLDSGVELRVDLDRDDLHRDEIALRRLDSDRERGTAVVGERPEMSDKERAERLAQLADRIFDPTWLDREALKRLERHEEDW